MRGRLQFRGQLAVTLSAAALVGCGADRTTGPDETARVADEFERAAAEMAFAAGPTAALTYQSAASTLRAGARASKVDITVDGTAETWYAFGHEIHIRPPAGTPTNGFEPPPIRAFLAWKATPSGMRVIHLMADGGEGEIRGLFPAEPVGEVDVLASPSWLMYAEGRNAMWEGVSGRQKSAVTPTTTPCPGPARPVGPFPAPTCVEASFTVELSGVDARPFVAPFGLVMPVQNSATGSRTIAMRSQTVGGVKVTLTLPALPPPPLVGPPLP